LCDALTGQRDSKKMLESLERGNLFVVSLDDNRQWYRYHHLFGGVLLSRLMEEHADQVPHLHEQASLWYEQHALLPDAIRHALSARDFEHAADLIEQVWPKTERYIQSAPWLGWVKSLPEMLVYNRPVLNTNYASALLDIGELEAGEVRLKQAEQVLANSEDQNQHPESSKTMVIADPEQFQQLPATIAAARAYLAGARGDMQGCIKYTRQHIDLLPEDDRNRREGAESMLAIAYMANGNLDEAYKTFERSFEGLRKAGELNDVGGAFILAEIRIAQGRLLEAINIYEEAFQLVPKQGQEPSGTAYLYLGRSKLYREQGNPTAASEYLLKSEVANRYAPYQLWLYRYKVAQAQVAVDQGNLDHAVDLLNKAEVLYYRNIIPEIRPLEALRVRIWIKQGKLSKALHWVKVKGLSVDDELSYLREFEHLTMVRILIAQFKSEQDESYILNAMRLLKRLLSAAEEGGRLGSVIEILIMEALANEAQGNISRGLVPFKRALVQAEPQGYVRVFVDEGAPMKRILTKSKANNIMPDYCDQLLAFL
jgi:LuxR family maltose regulon positive regulatory protein